MNTFRTDFSPEVLDLLDRLRGFIRETVPEVEERVYKGGCSAGYHTKQRGCFLGLWIEGNSAHLVFPKGEFLPDPEGLLQGGGKQTNYVKLEPGEAFPEDALFHLLVAALLVGAE